MTIFGRFTARAVVWPLLSAALLTSAAALAQQADSELRREVQQLREELRALQQEMREVRQALSPRRPSGWERVDNLTLAPEDSPQEGDPAAPLVLFEFSDYQCPYCSRHFSETFPQIERDFVTTGKLRYVIGELPMQQLHPLALKAAEAARCAGDQGKFWQMHARLFTHQKQLEPWSAHALALGLDTAKFQTCLNEDRYTQAIQRNASEALRAGLVSTPSFLLGVAGSDSVRIVSGLSGAAPYSAFKMEIESLLVEVERMREAR